MKGASPSCLDIICGCDVERTMVGGFLVYSVGIRCQKLDKEIDRMFLVGSNNPRGSG